jgi:hypothetical protein
MKANISSNNIQEANQFTAHDPLNTNLFKGGEVQIWSRGMRANSDVFTTARNSRGLPDLETLMKMAMATKEVI